MVLVTKYKYDIDDRSAKNSHDQICFQIFKEMTNEELQCIKSPHIYINTCPKRHVWLSDGVHLN